MRATRSKEKSYTFGGGGEDRCSEIGGENYVLEKSSSPPITNNTLCTQWLCKGNLEELWGPTNQRQNHGYHGNRTMVIQLNYTFAYRITVKFSFYLVSSPCWAPHLALCFVPLHVCRFPSSPFVPLSLTHQLVTRKLSMCRISPESFGVVVASNRVFTCGRLVDKRKKS